jgi:hypothetical protein
MLSGHTDYVDGLIPDAADDLYLPEPEQGFYDIGGRDLWDVSTFPDAGFQAKPRVEITFRPIKP